MSKKNYVPRSNFFRDVMGISEIDFYELPAKARCQFFNPKKEVLRTKEGTFKTGEFLKLKIEDLIKESDEKMKKKGPSKKKGKFNVIEGADTFDDPTWKTYEMVDVGAMQANPKNNDAVFDVASNFNALETTNPNQNITSKNSSLTAYCYDKTQGPFASISAAPGLILRRFFVNHKKFPDDCSKWEQKPIEEKYKDECVNLLENLSNGDQSKLFVSKGGYVKIKPYVKPNQDDYKQICIGFHKDVQVTHGAVNRNVHVKIKKKQIISQSFSAGVDLGFLSGGLNLDLMGDNETWPDYVIDWAQMILNSSREGILRASYLYDKKKVFLTNIGCGVFRNKTIWIANAIKRMEKFIVDSGLDVTLVWFDSKGRDHDFRKELLSIVKKTGGKYEQIYQGNSLNL